LDRLTILQTLYQADPADAFNVYALALELSTSAPLQAIKYFEILLDKHPEYTATYYHAAALYDTLGYVSKAQDTYEKGIEKTALLQKEKANRELNVAYENFRFENDL
jgi:tetratricopeptide (TPR) repeat protein